MSTTEPTPDERGDEVRARFSEALARKTDRVRESQESSGFQPKIHGTHGPAVRKRAFRRKNG
ncbi:DUF5302 domain-containing protein [Actinokineospora sp.]|uniref:DUF5302 domain-containing protein n=1 Tax=Actinokineospora sp. TaxID=1872133 RepID=UPI004037A4CE